MQNIFQNLLTFLFHCGILYQVTIKQNAVLTLRFRVRWVNTEKGQRETSAFGMSAGDLRSRFFVLYAHGRPWAARLQALMEVFYH